MTGKQSIDVGSLIFCSKPKRHTPLDFQSSPYIL